MKRFKKILRWILINGAFLTLILWASISGHPGLTNVAKVFIWLFAIMSWIAAPMLLFGALFMADAIRAKMPGGRVVAGVPGWLDVAFDCLVVGICAYSGWTITAVAWFLQMIACKITLASIESIRGRKTK